MSAINTTSYIPNPADVFFKQEGPGLKVIQQTGILRVRKGAYIFSKDDLADQVYFVVSGKVKLSVVNDDFKEVTKAVLGPGELFGEEAITHEFIRHDNAIALEETVLRMLSAREMLLLLHGRNDLVLYLMQLMVTRKRNLEQRLESLAFHNSRSRIIEFLVNFTTEKGQRVGYEWVLRKPITHQEIANLTATSRQTVTTTLNDLQALKLLKFNRKQLLIRDLDKLRAAISA